MATVLEKIADLEKQKDALLKQYEKVKANRTLKCAACGKMHKIKDCEVIKTYWYTPPRGCTEGDYWNLGEIQVICPDTRIRNRLLFSEFNLKEFKELNYMERRNIPDILDNQFKIKYLRLFKTTHELHNESYYIKDEQNLGTLPTINNYYVCENWKKFDLEIEQ